MLNFPKTGSSFARKVTKELYTQAGLSYEELLLPNIRNVQAKSKQDQHGTYCQIPGEHKNKLVVSIIRDPLDRLLSTYMYRAWADSPPLPQTELMKLFPDFPDLSIDQYLQLQDMSLKYRLGYDVENPPIGIQSIQMIQMFFKNPEKTLSDIFNNKYESDRLLSEMGEIKFLNQSKLRNDLVEFLCSLGFAASEVDFIYSKKASNVTNYPVVDKSTLITENLKAYIGEKEWLYNSVWKEM